MDQRRVGRQMLVATMLRLRSRVAARPMGFWLELLELVDQELLAQLDVGSGHSDALLEPGGPADGPRDARWWLIVNIPEQQLMEWREHRVDHGTQGAGIEGLALLLQSLLGR